MRVRKEEIRLSFLTNNKTDKFYYIKSKTSVDEKAN